MNMRIRILTIVLVLVVISLAAVAGDRDVLTALVIEDVEGARINLNPWGPHLGFEMEIDGDNPGLAALVSVIRGAEPAHGHKCANRGAIRFRMSDGGVIAVGLLPSHSEGRYDLRLYVGECLQSVYRVDRTPFLAALDGWACRWMTLRSGMRCNEKSVLRRHIDVEFDEFFATLSRTM